MILKITVKEVERLAHRLAKEMMSWDEPIPDFATRYPNILESCLAVPFQTFDKKNLYKNLPAQAAILFYLMVKNHPFQNGNKRIGVTTLLVFLYKNNKWLKVPNQSLYNVAVWMAQSPPEFREEVLQAIEKFIRENIVDSAA
jgi:death-on-curing family protein